VISVPDLPPPPDLARVRRALLSVSDKTGLADFARRLADHGVELLSTGGTAAALRDAGLAVTDVASVTGAPEILGGRVKSLHPAVHGGILARRTSADDAADLAAHGIGEIDLVAVNLYPFREATAGGAAAGVTDAVAAENIDIGGPAMLRAAAKNFAFVAAICRPSDYAAVADELDATGGSLSLATRRRLAGDAFAHTADYDAAIAGFLGEGRAARGEASSAPAIPERLVVDLPPALVLRYGENPHQEATLFGHAGDAPFEVLHGKALSFNNLLDLSASLGLISEFASAPPTVAILKHTNPCGVGQADSLAGAYEHAFATDRQSPFGGIVAVNGPLDLETAEAIDAVFTEIVIAPAFDDDALDFLRAKPNRRLVRAALSGSSALDVRSAPGGLLVQTPDAPLPDAATLRAAWSVPTQRTPTDAEWADLDFAWRVAKHVKSNAIVYARGGATLGIGAGQMSRIDASEVAVSKARKSGLSLDGAAVASDAFFPFADGLLAAVDAGAVAAVQPGGSVRDDDVIAAADTLGVAMVFTGRRHFRH